MSESENAGLFGRLKKGLSKTGSALGEGLGNLFLGKREIDDDLLEDIETQLIMSDVGIDATQVIIDSLTQQVARKELDDADTLLKSLKHELAAVLKPSEAPLQIDNDKKPYVILMIGVNGVGKTTSIGKLAKRFCVALSNQIR